MEVALNGSVLDRVTFAVKQTISIGDRTITPETRIRDDLALGKFGRIKLAMCLEEIFDIELLDDALEQFVTIADIVSYFGARYFRNIQPWWLSDAA